MTATFTADAGKIALSSQRTAYKTEAFISMTRRILGVDAFISRVAEGIFKSGLTFKDECCSVQTEDGRYTVFVCGKSASPDDNDILFYKFIAADHGDGVDRGLRDYLSSNAVIPLIMRPADDRIADEDKLRLYLVSGADGIVNFPRLNDNQRKIVATEDSNMLVQGVAGSGKTNVCVEKIVYCACRNYRGRVLYTTFSHGLLNETRGKVELFCKNIEDLISAFEAGNVVFLDDDHKKAIENKLGILFTVEEDGELLSALKRVAAFLREKVDYMLIEDLYARQFEFDRAKVAGEDEFLGEYLEGRGSRLSGALDKIKNISAEIVYKEIYGMIFGKYELSDPREMMSKEDYIASRSDSFTPRECETIYSVALDYADFLAKNGMYDNNSMSRALLKTLSAPAYSVGVIDEVQDFTQVNLCLIKTLCRKLFCVGDALQMINPAYFNFGYLKRLMYGDVTGVSELRHNYRSTALIERIAEKLSDMNISRFGTHSFVLKGESVPSSIEGKAAFVKDKNIATALREKRFENLTLIVGSKRKKDQLKRVVRGAEVLTVAEAKGLERPSVVLLDVLSDNIDKWRYLHAMTLNRKTADENSVFRYYFNLFYVGISRAKQNLLVAESDYPKFFDPLFDECFERMSRDRALAFLRDVAGKLEIDDGEFTDRIQKFCQLEQYDNARAAADRLSSDELRAKQMAYISVHERFLRYGNYREAGVEFWRGGHIDEARELFVRSGDEALLALMDACLEGGGSALDPSIVRFYPLVEDNEAAKNIILETLNKDREQIFSALGRASAEMRKKP